MVERVGVAPQSGIYRLDEQGEVGYRFFDYRRAAVETERDGFFLRITGPGDWRYEGADLGILITRGRLMSDDGEINERARQWLTGLTARYVVPDLDVVPALTSCRPAGRGRRSGALVAAGAAARGVQDPVRTG